MGMSATHMAELCGSCGQFSPCGAVMERLNHELLVVIGCDGLSNWAVKILAPGKGKFAFVKSK